MQEQHIEHMVRRSGRELASTYICHDHRGSAAAQVFPKKLAQRVSERTASTARSELLKKIASITTVREFSTQNFLYIYIKNVWR